MNITMSNTIETMASFLVIGSTVNMSGSYANAMKILTLETGATLLRSVGGKDYTTAEVNLHVDNSALMTGYLVFKAGANFMTCPLILYKQSGETEYIRPTNFFFVLLQT